MPAAGSRRPRCRAGLGELLDAAVAGGTLEQIRQVAAGVPDAVRIEKCRIRKSGLGLLVEIHIEVDGALTVRAGHEIAQVVADRLKASA